MRINRTTADLSRRVFVLADPKYRTFNDRELYKLGVPPVPADEFQRIVEQISQDLLQLNQGTLYPALLRMEQEGWISTRWGASEKNRKAKFYSITAAGRRVLAAHRTTWDVFVRAVNLVTGPDHA